mmetsp:Transcript_28555/g.36926  ORF Transcript_28555/g.36926 Transcript_28555/m.36926 type:complete len:1227 (+) Transcript_28555:37-3717(+)
MASRDVFADADIADQMAENARNAEAEQTRKAYDKMTPEEVFAEFDTDSSGAIDWAEFKTMLPQLGVQMNEAKALKYFNMADTDGGGDIDLDEFQSALFAINPNTGNTTGFQPSILLTPQDAFELFDVDRSGNIDEDEFAFVMEYMNVKLDGTKQEALFSKYDKDRSGSITYDEFRQIWLKVCNVKKELDDREVKYPKFATRSQLEKIMGRVILEEEEKERHALAEADQFKRWQRVLHEKRFLSNKARRRALLELRNALDLAGQVYTFGTGAYGQFTGEVSADIGTKASPFFGFDEVAKLWHGRVVPSESFLATIGANDPGAKKLEDLQVGVDLDADDPRTEILYSPFNHSICASNTAALWGRRVTNVALCANVAVALSELGEVFAWGGTDLWWHEVEEESLYGGSFRGVTTPRSQLLLQTGDIIPPEDEVLEEEEDPEEAEVLIYKEVLTYYNKWKAPPPGVSRLVFCKDTLIPTLDYDELALSFTVRGKDSEKKNKVNLMTSLYTDISLERRVLGLRSHRRIRETEEEIAHLTRRRKHKAARELVVEMQTLWQPVLEMQAEAAVEAELEARKDLEKKLIKKEKNYAKLRAHKHEARLDGKAKYTPRGGSLELAVSGTTARGNGSHTARGYAAVVGVSCGSNHIAAIHQSGELYTWGFGSAGRLGLDIGGQSSNPRADATHPTVVQGLLGLPVVQVACGYSHSAAVTADARLFVWGSASTGKLGLGVIADKEECYCSMPTAITVGDSVRVREVSCGSSHSACVTDKGELYVWGCADGGRLGLGVQRQETQFRPVKVTTNGQQGYPIAHKGSDHKEGTPAFGKQKILHVSCGNAHTLVSTIIREVVKGTGPTKTRTKAGGDVYMAGAQSVLGLHCSIFVKCNTLAEHCIDKISAGFSHCAASAASGELFCWGSNYTGCCGAPFPTVQFCYEPYNVPCIFALPINLALGKPCAQSTVYNGQDAYLGVDGNMDGSDAHFCLSTQSEAQPWWEVDLGDYACIQTVRVWNRTDEPHDASFDRETFRRRLFPCYVMLSQEPFPRDRSSKSLGAGQTLLAASLQVSCARMKLTKSQRCTTWHVPNNTAARYCRIMLEGLDFLHFAQVEVLGTPGINKPVGKCGSVMCGRNVTSVVIKASTEPADYDMAYKKAVWADAHNADILRQVNNQRGHTNTYHSQTQKTTSPTIPFFFFSFFFFTCILLSLIICDYIHRYVTVMVPLLLNTPFLELSLH